jgi:release factor glutamine methyltransferase
VVQLLTISELLIFGQNKLEQAGVEESSTDTWLLLSAVLGLSRTELFLAAKKQVDEQTRSRFIELLGRRIEREPVAYILGYKEFWSLPFLVTSDVLIPRPETEFMLDKVFSLVDKKKISRCLDLCCGSGAIACVLAKELRTDVLAVDISAAALAVTEKNIAQLNVDRFVKILQSDLFNKLENFAQFSLIVSNPPYISSEDVQNNLDPEVSRYEPHLALDGGVKGMDIIERIADDIPQYLAPGGHFFMEMGCEQGESCVECFSKTKRFSAIEVFQDYSGRDRVLHCIA